MMNKKTAMLLKVIILIAGAAFMLYPLLWMVASSFKPEALIFRELGLIPAEFTAEHYILGWNGRAGINFGLFFKNTILLVLCCIVGNVSSCSMTAYAFARLELAGKKVLFAVLMVSMMLPFHVVLLPRFLIFTKLHWINTYLPLIVPAFLGTNGFFCYMMVQFMRSIPRELDQAATIDGCGPVQIFFRILMPLCTAGTALIMALTMIWTWNDFFSQLIYIGNPELFTVALGLRTFIDATGASNYGQLFAMSVVSLLPIIIFFIIAQKQLMGGIAVQGLKG
ncbi:MAG: carbohydrate ABC transporter permease [Spirochaetaceae bacterium]|jgi:multiple sugar transport system permease protein|nr:carbohydrate ABC transporter permease [Spirochaetaceae bacterium]